MEFRVEPALPAAFEVLERKVERGQRGRRLAISRFRFRQSRPDERLKGPDVILLKQGGGPPDIREANFRGAGAQFHPGFQEGSESDPQGDAMLMRDAGQRLGERGRAIDIPADDLEHGAVHQAIGRGCEMAQFRDTRRRRVGDLPGAIDLAERPKRDRQIDRR